MLKEIEQGGLVAWNFQSNYQHLFATGSIQQQDQQQQHSIQIFKFDILDKSTRPLQVGNLPIESPCRSITWSTFGEENGYKLGLILAGLENGKIIVIDAEAIYTESQKRNSNPIIHEELDIFENGGPVESIQYNTLKPNLFAIGGEEVLIMDIQITQNGEIDPILFSPDADNNPHQNSTVTAVSWNKKLSYILASASQNGITVIWDLKSNKPIKSFGGDNFGTLKDVCLAWSPEIPTCVAKNEEEQKSQEIQLWDLRNPKGPVVILERGHQAHISCISWCTTDTSLIITGGYDQKVICWNIKDQTQVCVESFDEQIKDVNWSLINNLYSVTLKSGKVVLKSLHNDDSAIAPPKWYTPPVGARFSPNGDLVHFHESVPDLKINLRQIQTTSDSFLDFEEFFEQMSELSEQNQNLDMICEWKLKLLKEQQSQVIGGNSQEQMIWNLLKGLSSHDNEQIFETLGFKTEDIQKKAETYTGKTHKKTEKQGKQASKKAQVQEASSSQFAQLDEQGADDFFKQLAEESNKPLEQSQDRNLNNFKRLHSSSGVEGDEIFTHETISKNINWDTSVEKVIKENLIIANYEGAIDSAMKCGRQAEALLLAYSQGTETFESVMKDYFTSNTDPFIKNVLRNVVKKNNLEMVQVYNLDHWKECAGLLISQVPKKAEFCELMNILGERFISEQKDESTAILCFILAENFDRLAQLFFDQVSRFEIGSANRKSLEVNRLEILVVLNQFLLENSDREQSNKQFNQMIYETARYLYEDNLLYGAYSILEEADPGYLRIANFKDLLFNSHPQKISPCFDAPVVPYKIKNLRVIQQQQNKNTNSNRKINNNMNNQQPNFPKNNMNNNNIINNNNSMNQPPINNNNNFNKNNNNNNFNQPPPVKKNTVPGPPPKRGNNTFNNNNPAGDSNPFGASNSNNTSSNNLDQSYTQQQQNSNTNLPPPPMKNNNNMPPPNNNMNNNRNNNQFTNQPNNNNFDDVVKAPPPVAKKEVKPKQGPKYVPPPVFGANKQHAPTVNNNTGFNPNNNNNFNNNNNNIPNPPVNNNNSMPTPPVNNRGPPPPANRGGFAPPPVNNKPGIGAPPVRNTGASNIGPPPMRKN